MNIENKTYLERYPIINAKNKISNTLTEHQDIDSHPTNPFKSLLCYCQALGHWPR